MSSIITTEIIVGHRCGECGILFGMPDDFLTQRKRDGKTFYCPNGHGRHYSETEAQRLKKQLERAQQNYEYMRNSRDAARDQADSAERSRRALKGVVTRQRNRAAAGVCPVDGCHRHFQNLQRHIAGQHPDFASDEHPDPS